jgi:hypothetical protein
MRGASSGKRSYIRKHFAEHFWINGLQKSDQTMLGEQTAKHESRGKSTKKRRAKTNAALTSHQSRIVR